MGELKLSALQARALELVRALPQVQLGKERVEGSRAFEEQTKREVTARLNELNVAAAGDVASQSDVPEQLAHKCIEMASFLFAAGAPHDVWRQWCAIAGELFFIAGDRPYSLQLLTISKKTGVEDLASRFGTVELTLYREQAIRSVVTWSRLHQQPTNEANDEVDLLYKRVVDDLTANKTNDLGEAIAKIAEFWLAESGEMTFESGVFPVFEPESNALAAGLTTQGYEVKIQDARIRRYLEAGLA